HHCELSPSPRIPGLARTCAAFSGGVPSGCAGEVRRKRRPAFPSWIQHDASRGPTSRARTSLLARSSEARCAGNLWELILWNCRENGTGRRSLERSQLDRSFELAHREPTREGSEASDRFLRVAHSKSNSFG